jgi:hypothetical protein
MGSRIIKTPNGKYAAFADPVDHFVAYDMTREEAVQFCVSDWNLGARTAEAKVQRAEEDKTRFGGTGRFEEAINTICLMHGAKEAIKYRTLLESSGPVTGKG